MRLPIVFKESNVKCETETCKFVQSHIVTHEIDFDFLVLEQLLNICSVIHEIVTCFHCLMYALYKTPKRYI